MILVLRTDKPDAEIGLFDGSKKLAYETWRAHRQLSETIHKKIALLLQNHQQELGDITGVVVYHGPGSFTGLRIGISVANALAYSLQVPVVGATGDDWVQRGIDQISDKTPGGYVLPEYGAPVHITLPKK